MGKRGKKKVDRKQKDQGGRSAQHPGKAPFDPPRGGVVVQKRKNGFRGPDGGRRKRRTAGKTKFPTRARTPGNVKKRVNRRGPKSGSIGGHGDTGTAGWDCAAPSRKWGVSKGGTTNSTTQNGEELH